jgi:hypothetical protein
MRWLANLLVKLWWTAPILAVIGTFMWFTSRLPQPAANDVGQAGQFGDSFGAVTSLFTGLGFCGLILTLVLQQRQLALQERQLTEQRRKDEQLRFEETLFRLLALYKETLTEVSNPSRSLTGRTLLRGSVDRALAAVKKERVNLIPHGIQNRLQTDTLTESDSQVLDYLYFRNFKILTVELDRQGRLINTLKVLLGHIVEGAPEPASVEAYRNLVLAQLTYVEVSYFFLVALTFESEGELRSLMVLSGILERAAHIKRLKIHDLMYQTFWGEKIREYKQPIRLPISDARIARGLAAYRKYEVDAALVPLRTYVSPRVTNADQAAEPRPQSVPRETELPVASTRPVRDGEASPIQRSPNESPHGPR